MSLKQKFLRVFKSYWINVFYISIFFSVFTDYRRLILAHYGINYGAYGISLIKGLVLAKVILIAEHLHIGQGFEDRPLIIPTVYKTLLFTCCVIILGSLEALIRMYLQAGKIAPSFDRFIEHFSYEWFAGTLIVFIFFIPFFGIRELSRVLGEGKISGLFFNRKKG